MALNVVFSPHSITFPPTIDYIFSDSWLLLLTYIFLVNCANYLEKTIATIIMKILWQPSFDEIECSNYMKIFIKAIIWKN